MIIRPTPPLTVGSSGSYLLATSGDHTSVWLKVVPDTRTRTIISIDTDDLAHTVHQLRMWADRLDYTLQFNWEDLTINGDRYAEDLSGPFFGFHGSTGDRLICQRLPRSG